MAENAAVMNWVNVQPENWSRTLALIFPWRISADLKRFKQLTMGSVMIMGRRTFDSLPGLLPGRRHVVLTRDRSWSAAGAEVAHSVDDPSSHAEYYSGLEGFLRTQDPGLGRLEIPALRQHWEASFIAPVFPLARGWERQVDIRFNAPLYDPALTYNRHDLPHSARAGDDAAERGSATGTTSCRCVIAGSTSSPATSPPMTTIPCVRSPPPISRRT